MSQDLIKAVTVYELSRAWCMSKEYEFGSPENMDILHGFAKMMDLIKNKYGEDFMVEMYHETCKNVNEKIQVLPGFVLIALEKRGEKFDIHSYARPAL